MFVSDVPLQRARAREHHVASAARDPSVRLNVVPQVLVVLELRAAVVADLRLASPVGDDVEVELALGRQRALLPSPLAQLAVVQLWQLVLLEGILRFKLLSTAVTLVSARHDLLLGLVHPLHVLAQALLVEEVETTLATLHKVAAAHLGGFNREHQESSKV